MGKEQDLLNAGKTGNVSQIEKILGQRGKKSGLHSIIVRSTNPNYQDEMGYTPLHYASLNGHRAAVELLLKYDASANIPDHSGNYPLHLAAFNGHAEVCRVLINSGPSRAKVNEQNGTEDTAMHSAAQSKSSQVVAVLLENHADPFIRNCRKQSPLDLAAQYGRMENVKLLLSYHPNLLQTNVKTHSPLHLAARNGHIDVVSNLLGCGMSVNTECDTGTALHEAALYGKLDVCNFLLQCDVDISIKDKNQMTVMDLLMSHPSSKTKEISALIYNYTQTKGRSKSTTQGPNTGSFKDQYSSAASPTKRASTISYRSSNYDDIPDHRFQMQGPPRRDTYDAVPAPVASPSQYDSVPAPQLDSAKEDEYAYSEARHGISQNVTVPSPNISGYSYLAAPGEQTSGSPILTPRNVQDGYTMLGIPVPKGNKQGYTTVRSEGSPTAHSGSPKSGVMERQRISTGGGHGDPLPSKDMMSTENVAYYKIEPHTCHESLTHPTQTPTTAQNSISDYEVVPSHPKQRALDIPVYEVPPAPIPQPRQQPAKPVQPEGDYGLIGATVFTPKPTKPIRHQKGDDPENPVAVSSPVYEVPPTFKQKEEISKGLQGKTCPLDFPKEGMDRFEQTGASPLGPDANALATQPGYEFMGPGSAPDDTSQQYEYELVAPNREQHGFKGPQPTNGQYELLSLAKTKPETSPQPSFSQSPPIYEIAPPPILAPQEPRPAAPITSQGPPVYEVPPPFNTSSTQKPPLYEIAPPIVSTTSAESSIYEIAPPPRPKVPDRPPTSNAPRIGAEDNEETATPVAPPRTKKPHPSNVPLIENMEYKEPVPQVSPRETNPYQKCPVQPTGDRPVSTKPPTLPPPYEQVRIEAPKGKLNTDQPVPVIPPRTYMGDYCTLDPNAVGSINPPPSMISKREDVSSGSSFGSASSSDVSEIPGNPPPSPRTAEAAVFEALETSADKNQTRPDGKKVPVPSPRRESLHDKPKWYSDEEETKDQDIGQDPFSNPPAKKEEINLPLVSNTETTDFASMHNRFSPYGSRENLTEESSMATKEETSEEEEKSHTPLIYENVLFIRNDGTTNNSKTKIAEAKTQDMENKLSVVDNIDVTKNRSPTTSDPSSLLDEEAEWEKIDQLLLSFGDIENIEQTADAGKAKTIPEWLNALGVGQYESEFMANGFDSLDFLNGGVLEDQDLLAIGVADFAHRKVILDAIKSLPSTPLVAKLENPPTSVEEWLTLIKLSEYLQSFLHHGFNTMDRVKQLWEVELTSVLEINCLGHRNRILASLIEPRRMTIVRKSRQTEIDSKGNFGLDEKLAELSEFCPDEEKPNKVADFLDSKTLERIADEMINDEALKKKTIKRKSEKMWKHEPEVLLKGSVNYTTQYLGSQTVKEIVGVSSTVEACRKMKLSTAKLQKIPSVTLAVSVSGIKFIDSRTKLVVSNHKINNVSYITQDPENRRIFAYIAKDTKVNKHYCHVFRVDDLEISNEVTMTIGQAFELAYDQFLQIQSHMNSRKS